LKPNVGENINVGIIIYTPLFEDKRNFLEKLKS